MRQPGRGLLAPDLNRYKEKGTGELIASQAPVRQADTLCETKEKETCCLRNSKITILAMNLVIHFFSHKNTFFHVLALKGIYWNA